MSAAVRKSPVRGAKGGEAKQKQPSIASNSTPSIATARIVYIWSWGPIVGPVNGRNSVKLDGTPLVAEDGTENYPGVKWQFRNGELNQTRLDGIAESSNEIDVNQTLLSTTPYLHSINNPVLDGVRIRFGWPQLQSQDQSGNINGVRIDYAIDVQTDSGPFVEVLTSFVDRKNVTKYERSHRINLPAGTRWTIRARRITPEANSSLVQDAMVVEAIAEVVDSDQEFPLTSVGCIEYDAQQFGGDIAKIAILMRGKIVRVPTNYNPETRTYATGGTGTSNGVWDGTFKEAYTNNPAWIFYDLVLDPYYGLGERIDATMIDRWNLYRIGQYCDQMVPDGAGGLEPRYTCNIYLQKQADAYAVLQDLAQAFHGMTTWDGSQITVNADMPGDPVYTYNPSQILNNGEIKYAGTRARDRHNQAMVTWDNPAQGYDTDKEPVFDDQALAESGSVNELSVDAYGCTSRGQAQRAGQWALITEQAQIRGGSFRVGLDGQIPKPGQIIALADPMLAGRANGGRISAVAGRVVTLDREAELPAGGKLRVNLPSGKSEARVISSISGRKVTIAAVYSEVPEAECGWIIEHDDLKTMQFLVRNITRPEWHQFQLDCIQHEPSKFDAIDFGAVIDDRPISGIPVGTQDAPAQVLLSQHVVIEQGIAVTVMTIGWSAAPGAVAYDVEWRWGSREWIKVPRTGELSVDVRGIYAGQYLARVRAVSALNVSSLPTTSVLTNLNGKVGLPPAITSLTTESLIFGIGLKWTFPPDAEDTQRTELWYSQAPQLDSATKLADLAYPQSDYTMQGLRAGQSFFFWARLVDRTGNVGPWFPQAPTVVNGQASADADDILDYLVGQITESQLGQELLSEIGKIGGDGPGSVNERLDQVKSDLSDQITDVSNTVTEVQTELQAQIDQIADLADSLPYKADQTYTTGQGSLGQDGIIYQALQNVPINTPPPNATYWLNVGQAVQTANGLAARVTTAETKITSIEGVNTAQASQITGLQTSLDGKADSSVVSSLSSRVTTAENSISSQGTAITGLNNSLTATNQNVTAAQNAANAANTLAGGKGKVIVQSAAPAAADQLAQNLWIDTTNNANTPKRWTGSAWAAVTDKAATDAATAAANALALAQTKADASAVNSLTTRVTSAEGTISSQGTRVTSLENTINSPSTGLGTKASSAAVDALTSRVTQTETSLTSVSGQLTTLNNSIGSMGGDNLLPNSSFDQLAADGTRPAWWRGDQSAGATNIITQVDSPLPLSTKAIRCSVVGLANGSYMGLTFQTTDGERPKVVAGQPYTLSVSARLSSPSARLAMYMQWINDAGAVISTAQLPETSVGTSFNRYSFTATAPAGAVRTQIFPARLINRSGAAADMWIELDNVQLQEGATLTAYSPSVQAVTAAQAATSAAVDSLSSTVTQQGTTLTSVTARTTTLENAVNSTTDGLATKASSSAVQTLTNRVTAVEGVNTAQSSSITDLQTSVSTIQGSLGASGLDPADGGSWNFDSTAEGWTATNSSLAFPSAGVMRQTATAADPSISVTGLSINGGLYSKVRVSITRRAGAAATDWDGRLFYSTSGHGISSSYVKVLANPNLAIGSSVVLEFDMAALTAGGTDWVSSTITVLRLDLGLSSGGAFDVDWIAVGRVAPSASSRALSSLTSTVTQQGSTISSQAQSITGLTTTVNNQGAALQVQATALADTSGKVSSSYTVKLGVMADGRRWAAGFGIGLDNSSGTTQSQFVVSADTFAVLNADSSASGTFTSPFMVSGGQVFIRDTVIQKATITNALIGQSIYSQTLTNYGQPVMTTDYNSGQITIQNKATNGKYMLLREDGLFAVSGGVVILELRV
ncbi:TipJ family phage tail tip protein [Pseudomonas abietaniphila]